MKKKILDRYARTPDQKIIIDIAATKVADLYNDFDNHAPYVKKELDQNLVDYLIDSVSEIGHEKFVIQFRLTTLADNSLTSRVQTSIHNYFLYLKELEFRQLARMTTTSFILLFIGALILSLSVWMNQKMEGHETVLSHVFSEGLMVAAWVALWNAIATFLINWAPRRRQIKMYERIATAPILFHATVPDSQQ